MTTTKYSEKENEAGTFSEYKKRLSIQQRAKAAYASAISQNVFSGINVIVKDLLKKIPNLR